MINQIGQKKFRNEHNWQKIEKELICRRIELHIFRIISILKEKVLKSKKRYYFVDNVFVPKYK